MNEDWRNEPPVLMFVEYVVVLLRAKVEEDSFGEPAPQYRGRHPARFPHQQEDEKVCDDEDDREDVGTTKHRPGIVHRVTFMQRQQRRRGLSQRRIAHLATAFARTDQRAAIAANTGTTGMAWLVIRQALVSQTGSSRAALARRTWEAGCLRLR